MPFQLLCRIGVASGLFLSMARPTTVSATTVPLELPIKIGTAEGEWEMFVNDANPDRALYGGHLKAMDVYIAKMYEISHYMCSTGRQSPQLSWNFQAKQGPDQSFNITCQQAQQIANEYGFGDREATAIYFSYEEAGGEQKILNIPMLKIPSGQKLTNWVNFTQNLRK